jgi:hypothetical protein
MSRFHKLLEQQYLKLDIKPDALNPIQKDTVDKMVASGKTEYEGIKDSCAVVSYDVNGQKGKFKIDAKGVITPQKESEEEESATSGFGKNSMSKQQVEILRTLMSPEDQRIVDTAKRKTVSGFVDALSKINQKLSKIQ